MNQEDVAILTFPIIVFLVLVTFDIWPFNDNRRSGYRPTGELPDAVRPPRGDTAVRGPDYCHHCGAQQRAGE